MTLPFAKGALVPSLAWMPGLLTPSAALADGRLLVLFEENNKQTIVLRNHTNWHQLAFMELLDAAIHFAYVL